jgi:ATP-dependent DNA ligase
LAEPRGVVVRSILRDSPSDRSAAKLAAARPSPAAATNHNVGQWLPVSRKLGCEGIVSKRRDRLYQGGRSKYWIKVKNRKLRQ